MAGPPRDPSLLDGAPPPVVVERGADLPGGRTLRVEVTAPEDAEALAVRAFRAAVEAVTALDGQGAGGSIAPRPLIGDSAPMRELRRLLTRVRASDATVLVTGENGTGKELVARAIHLESRRRDGPFVAINCSAFQDQLLESELFGHVRGAFTGALQDKPGRFDMAHRGTLFLDEVGEMSPALQVKLLRVLQEGAFLPVGGMEGRQVDVRIVAATNRDLEAAVASGAFREDLYYRLHVVHLRVPPLRERREDIPPLVAHFLERLARRHGTKKSIAGDVRTRLELHDWPGNVRELENEIERLWVLSGDEPVIRAEGLSPAVARAASSAPPRTGADGSPATLPEAVEALERRMIGEALARHRGNKTRAAAELGVSRRNLIRKVQAYALEPAGADEAS